MGSNDGAIQGDHLEAAPLRENLKDFLPNALFGPSSEALIYAIPRPKSGREISPGNTGPSNVDNCFDKGTVVAGCSARVAAFAGQDPLNLGPLVVSK